MTCNHLLSPRFENDGVPIVELNQVQERTRNIVLDKINSGEYSFIETSCPVCDGDKSEQLSEKDRYGFHHPVVICTACGLIRVTPRMSESSFSTFYEKEYRLLYEPHEDWQSERFRIQQKSAEKVHSYLSDHLGNIGEASIVDIGSGPGGMLSYFQSQGHKVAGCDLDNQAVAYGRGQGVPLTHGSVTDLNLNWTPDIVILSHVVEHFLSPVSDLQDIRRLLDADSRLYVEVPGIKRLSPLSAYYQADFLRQLQNAHNFYFSARSLGNLFRTAMFSVENINEDIRAIFAPADINNIEIRPDYQDALNHLQRLEWYHRYNLHRLGTIPQLAYHPAVLSALKRTGLYPFAKRVHDAFF